ncbi:MAG: xanthine dehydrogenase family protein subunit M [Acidimicrobiia bacterium]|nr:xanthine dehydrogenase family protein subunit M [Acidimicrobiia bacterium]
MKPPRFDYVAVRSVAEATEALAQTEDARILAGGQSLVPLMNLRLARPRLLVDVNGVRDLVGFGGRNGTLRFGAMCRHRFLETDPLVHQKAPIFAETAALIGHVHIRNRGTLGGSIAHADPVAELPALLVALDGRVIASGTGRERAIPAAELFAGPFTTSLDPTELLTAVEVPAHTDGDGGAFSEFVRRHGDFATAGVAVIVHRDASGTCESLRIAGCGLGPTPVDLSAAGEFLLGESELGDGAARELGKRVAAASDPPGDVHGSKDYRRDLAAVLAADAVRRAWQKAGAARRDPGG